MSKSINRKRVVVTGMGSVNPLGMNVDALWQNMLAGKCGIVPLTSIDLTDYKVKIGAQVNRTELAAALEGIKVRPSDRAVDMALLASSQALADACIMTDEPSDIGTLFGTGVGCSESLYNANTRFAERGVRGLRPTSVPRCMANAISSQISMKFKLTGPNYVLVSACSSATSAIGTAFRMIQDGHASTILCGGSDSPFDPLVFGAWDSLGVMSKNADPTTACRPFDANRDGCILGEGAGALLMESLEHASERNAHIHAELCGYGESSDAGHMTRPSQDGQVRAIRGAVASAGIELGEIGFINAHGTATRTNDECESGSIRAAMAEHADRILIASNKSFFGHMLGASGVAESIVVIEGLKAGIVPQNLNLDDPDPACRINLVADSAEKIDAPVALKNSFGFGGGNAVLVWRRWES